MLTVIPAYGRDYHSATEAIVAWEADKDFQITSVGRWCGSWINLRNAREEGLKEIAIRYNKQRDITIVEIKT